MSHGLSPARLQRIDAHWRERYVDQGKLAGALTLVARRGEIAHLGVVGHADTARGVLLAEDTIFRIYSMTKPLTSVAMMMLIEDGAVALDDPVEKYIPAWKDMGVFVAGAPGRWQTKPTARSMQIIDLLRHTSGLTYGFQDRTAVDAAYRRGHLGVMASKLPLADMIAGWAAIPLEFSPGEAWNYSNSTDVLGYLVGVISGRPFEDFLRERVIKPLGMTDTDFHVPANKVSRFAACYALGPNQSLTVQDDPIKSHYLSPPPYISGGGGLVSTAADYLAFCRMMLNGGTLDGVRLLSRKTVDLMTANHLPGGQDLTQLSQSLFSEATLAGVGFGLGFAVTLDPAKTMLAGSAGEYYWGGAASTAFWIDPVEDLIVVFMTQFMPSNHYPLRRELRTLVYSAFDD